MVRLSRPWLLSIATICHIPFIAVQATADQRPLPTQVSIGSPEHASAAASTTTNPPLPGDPGSACLDDIGSSDNRWNYCDITYLGYTITSGYTISTFACPTAAPYARTASGLNSDEQEWLAQRTASAYPALQTYLSDAWSAKSQYPIATIMQSPPRIGVAVSGGGFRAMLNGAGVLQAFDSTSSESVAGFSGLLDSALYISGLSGGAWLVGSWALNGYPPTDLMVSGFGLLMGTLTTWTRA
jgi:hypothetical protein